MMAESFVDITPQVIKDANTTGQIVWAVAPYITGSIQIEAQNLTAWTSCVVKIRRSNNGITFKDFPLVVSLSEDGITPNLDLTGTAWICAEVTTANGAALALNCWGVFKT